MNHVIRSKVVECFVKQIWPMGRISFTTNGGYQYVLQQGKINYKKNPKWFIGLYGCEQTGYAIMLIHSHRGPWGKEQHESLSFDLTSLPFLTFKKNKLIGVTDKTLIKLYHSLSSVIQVNSEALKEFNKTLELYDKFKET